MKAQQDLAAGSLFLVLGLGMIVVARGYPPGAAMLPIGIGGFMAALAVALLVRTVRQWASSRSPNLLVDHWPRFLLPFAGALAFALVVSRLGFYTTSAILVLTLPPLLGFRRFGYVFLSTILFIALLVFTFAFVLGRRLPLEFFLK